MKIEAEKSEVFYPEISRKHSKSTPRREQNIPVLFEKG